MSRHFTVSKYIVTLNKHSDQIAACLTGDLRQIQPAEFAADNREKKKS